MQHFVRLIVTCVGKSDCFPQEKLAVSSQVCLIFTIIYTHATPIVINPRRKKNLSVLSGQPDNNFSLFFLVLLPSDLRSERSEAHKSGNFHSYSRGEISFSVCFYLINFASLLSCWDFSHVKFGSPFLGFPSCDRVALPNLRCILSLLVVP